MNDLAAYLRQQRSAIEDALDRAIPAADERPSRLHDAMRYAVFTGGKRLRPVLCLAAADAVPADRDTPGDASSSPALDAALAVELLHTYTLVHDDLPCMDDDDMRRGRPTVHVKFDQATAVLVGDALQALAFEMVARAPPATPYPAGRLVAELARAAGSRGVVGGQAEDIACGAGTTDKATLDFIHRHKTADLFRAAVRMGAIAAGATDDSLRALTEYATALGLAFQIVDDLLDANDEADGAAGGELSCLSVYSAEEARRLAASHIEKATSAVAELPGFTAPLTAIAQYSLTRTG